MIKCQFLEQDDKIQLNDWYRPLIVYFDGQSDTFMTSSCYGGGPINNFKWISVNGLHISHMGKTVKEFNDMLRFQYEFVRGDVPEQSKLKWTISK